MPYRVHGRRAALVGLALGAIAPGLAWAAEPTLALATGSREPLVSFPGRPGFAEELARESGLGELTPRHWRVVLCCREAAAREGSAPDLCTVSRLAGLPPAELDRLFRRPPSGPSRLYDSFDSFDPFESLLRIAGLSQPPKWIDVP